MTSSAWRSGWLSVCNWNGGNKYRLVAAIAYAPQLVWVKAVLTHAEYDKGAWK
jgi:mRNA-degrading endonuclease HigB of HigAB toxin-antitoxin module